MTDIGSAHAVELRFTDGETRTVTVEPGQTVLAAAKAAGHNLVSQCEVGTCSTCVGQLCSGSLEMPGDRPVVLSQREIDAGQRLLCQAHALSDAVVDLEYPVTLLDANPAREFTTRIARVTWLADSVVELKLKVPKGMKFGFTAGQYCRLQVPGTDEWRSYSMANGEHEKNMLTFIVRVLPTGVMSDFLRTNPRVGTDLVVDGPRGGFVLEPVARPHVLIAGGTGLAPMLSMLDRLRTVQPAPPEVLLIFGCARAGDLFHEDELEARSSWMPTLVVRKSLDDNADRSDILLGNPVSVLEDSDIKEDSIAYLCGPPGMIRAAEERLTSLGIPLHDIRSEQFLDSSN